MLCACGPHLYPLKDKYISDNTAIRQYPSDKKDELWGRIMTFFATNDIPIKTIDKSAGFIKSERLNFKPYAWGEVVNLTYYDSTNKYIVTVRVAAEPGDPALLPKNIYGAIKIYTIDSAGLIQIRVNIDGLTSDNGYYYKSSAYSATSYYEVYTLGKLEKAIADYIIGKGDMPVCRFNALK